MPIIIFAMHSICSIFDFVCFVCFVSLQLCQKCKMSVSMFNYILIAIVWISLSSDQTPVTAWKFHSDNDTIKMHMHEVKTIKIKITDVDGIELVAKNATLSIDSESDILKVSHDIIIDDIVDNSFECDVNLTAEFLGAAKVYATIIFNKGDIQISNETLNVIITREERLIDRLFTISVATLVSILYINFGAALDLGKVKEILVRPIGPLIAFVCQFLFMPLVSYIIVNTINFQSFRFIR